MLCRWKCNQGGCCLKLVLYKCMFIETVPVNKYYMKGLEDDYENVKWHWGVYYFDILNPVTTDVLSLNAECLKWLA